MSLLVFNKKKKKLLLTKPVLGLGFFHKIPMKELVPGDVEQFLSRVSKVEFTTKKVIKNK